MLGNDCYLPLQTKYFSVSLQEVDYRFIDLFCRYKCQLYTQDTTNKAADQYVQLIKFLLLLRSVEFFDTVWLGSMNAVGEGCDSCAGDYAPS